jgi:acetolactate synthase-1/2/3 large subunit
VLALIGDGSAMYTPQALWTLAREGLNVTAVIWANQSYRILRGELTNVGVQNPGPRAVDMLSLDRPNINWCDMARSMGVPAERATTTRELADAFARSAAEDGPTLIEAIVA